MKLSLVADSSCKISEDLIGIYKRPKGSSSIWQPLKYYRGIKDNKGEWSLFALNTK